MRFNYAQLERLWLDAGGPESEASRAAATAEAESRGNPDAQYPGKTIPPGTGSWDTATGLWQILGPPTQGDWQASQLTDPFDNAQMAVAKYDEAGWQPWAGDDWAQFYRAHVPPAPSVPGVNPQGGIGAKPSPYGNPLRDVQNLTPERIDMGVDYGGTGPIYALGPGEITNITNSGWPGGAFIGERLSQGPLAGHYVYAAEDIQPTVQVGQKVDASTVIGNLTGGGIETGFAAPPGTGNALGASQFSGGNTTAYGQAYSDLLHDLGAPAGIPQNKPPTGTLPGWLIKGIGGGISPGVGPGVGGGIGGSAGGGLFGGIENAINNLESPFADAAAALHGIEEAISWFTPSKILRTLCFFAGSGLVAYGVVSLARPRVNLPVLGSTPVVPAGELGPAFGIASVTIGSVLLFFAFHNVQASTFAEFLGAIRGRLHGQPVQQVTS